MDDEELALAFWSGDTNIPKNLLHFAGADDSWLGSGARLCLVTYGALIDPEKRYQVAVLAMDIHSDLKVIEVPEAPAFS